MKLRVMLAAMLLGLPGIANAQTVIASVTSGSGTGGSDAYVGESFTTTTLIPMTNITFNLFSDFPAVTPAAFGTGFLLSQEYLGSPNGLSAATPGYLGQAPASGGLYSFGLAVTLQPATQYFFYENGLIPANSITGGAAYSGGEFYLTTDPTGDGNFGGDTGISANFLVQGFAAVPEPTTWALIGVGTLGLVCMPGERNDWPLKREWQNSQYSHQPQAP